jgi:hypothetical protein
MPNLAQRYPQVNSAIKSATKLISEMSAQALFAACRPDHRAYREPCAARPNWAYRSRGVRS